MSATTFFYAPLLHRKHAPGQLSQQVCFLPPGHTQGARVALAEQACAAALPLRPAQARAVLEEMVELGARGGGLLQQYELLLQQVFFGFSLQKGEGAALSSFAATGQVPSPELGLPNKGAESLLQALICCQKTLMLAYELEQYEADLRLLEDRYEAAQNQLAVHLGEEDAAELLGTEARDTAKPFSAPCSWQRVVEAGLAFLPEKAALFTADPDIGGFLSEAKLLQPLPEQNASVGLLWSIAPGEVFGQACLPGWQIVGYNQAVPERPWLNRDVLIYALQPAKDWVEPV